METGEFTKDVQYPIYPDHDNPEIWEQKYLRDEQIRSTPLPFNNIEANTSLLDRL